MHLSYTSKVFLPKSTKLQILSTVLKPKLQNKSKGTCPYSSDLLSVSGRYPISFSPHECDFLSLQPGKLLLKLFRWLTSHLLGVSLMSPPETGPSWSPQLNRLSLPLLPVRVPVYFFQGHCCNLYCFPCLLTGLLSASPTKTEGHVGAMEHWRATP